MSWQSALVSLAWAVIGQIDPPTRIVLAIPRITRKGIVMPNYELMDDTIATVPIQTTNDVGVVEPPPTGDTFTAVSSLPASLGVSVVTSPVLALVLTPLVQASPGITVTVSDSAGLKVATQLVDIVTDTTPTNVILDLAGATTVSQPVPSAPGP
jgi:hypothetical protein